MQAFLLTATRMAAQSRELSQLVSGAMVAHACRLRPGDDLVSSLQQAAEQAMGVSETQSACILTAVGSLSSVQLRMANASCENDASLCVKQWDEYVEIVSLVGTFSKGGKHLHMSISDKDGMVHGGHVMSGTIFTTCEVVFGTLQNVSFCRETDDETGYSELIVKQLASNEASDL